MEQQVAATGTFCTGCGNPMGPDAHFCGQCGTKREA
jgi:predicted amidophosphoribosyltransferase